MRNMLVFLVFKCSKIVPWLLKNRWVNCLYLISFMSFFVTHIYRGGNHRADKLANYGLSLSSYAWWSQLPNQIRNDYIGDRLEFPYF